VQSQPKANPLAKSNQTRVQDKTVRSIAVYRHGQPRDTQPACIITKATAQQWWEQGAGQTADRGKVFILSKPVTASMQLRSPLGGEALVWRYLRGEEEAVALVHSYAPTGFEACV
jgi:hypothetical protein